MTPSDANQEQRTYWNDQAGPRWVKLQERLDAQIQPLGLVAMQRADIKPGENVLDVGCGCGQTSLELAERVGQRGSVTGVDLSAPMLARARERQHERQLTNVVFRQGDVQTYAFERASTDVLFSRFGVMFFADPVAAFANVRTALRPAGRLCFVCWQGLDKNEWAQVPLLAAAQHVPLLPRPEPGTPGPFAFADQDRVASILTGAGFEDICFESYATMLSMGGATSAAHAADFAMEIGPVATMLRDAAAEVRDRVRETLVTSLVPYTKENSVTLGAAVWIVHARSLR